MKGKSSKQEEQDVEEERKAVLSQMEREEAVRKEREEQVQSLKKKVEEVREGGEELGGKITERKVFLASLEEKRRGMEGQILGLSEN